MGMNIKFPLCSIILIKLLITHANLCENVMICYALHVSASAKNGTCK